MAGKNGPVFGRVMVAAVTPFDSRGRVDFAAAGRLLTHLQKNCDSIVVGGTTGEGPTLSDKERFGLLEFYKEKARRGFQVLANIGTNDTGQSVRLARAAAKLGADGLMAVGPYYNKPNRDGQLAHFQAICEATDLPVLLYNIPGRSGLRVEHDVIVELAAETTVVAVKDATADLEGVARLRSQTLSDFFIYSGDDTLTLPMLAVGGCGVVSVVGHLIGDELRNMILAFEEGNTRQALDIHLHYMELMREMFMTTNPIPIKAAVARLGLVEETYRLPMTPLSSEMSARLDNVLREYRLVGSQRAGASQ